MLPSIPRETLLTLARQYGLPLYVYNANVINRQIESLRHAFNLPLLDIRYASKALNTIGILRHIHAAGCGIDTVSIGEMQIALRAGIDPSHITFTPSGVLMKEYEFAVSNGIHVHADQTEALLWLDRHFPGLSVTLRFNPGVEAGSHSKVQVGAAGSKFGFTRDQVAEVKTLTEQLSLVVRGVHMHIGSDIGDSSPFHDAFEYLLSVGLLWKETLEHIDMGGGFKVMYHPNDHAIDLAGFGEKVTHRFTQYCADLGRDLRLILEPGKYLVSEAGHLLMQVSAVRHSGDHPMAFVSSGFNHFLRPMNYDAYHHFVNLSHPHGEIMLHDLVGYLCETDTFASHRPMPEIHTGDILCMLNAGAYGYTMASNYNSRTRPAEVLYNEDGSARLIRRAETLDDLLATDLGAASPD